MNAGKIVLGAIVIALLAVVIFQELRFARHQQVLVAEREARAAEAAQAHAAQRDAPDELANQLQATRSQLLEVRADLVSAKRQLTNTLTRMAALEQQVQVIARQAATVRSPRTLTFTPEGMGFVADAQPVVGRGRPWGEEQVVGPPDTHQAGDISTAWASKLPDGGEEWLKVDYSNTVWLAEVRVRETYNPGAISRVAAVLADGQEVVLWEGVAEPLPAPSDTAFAVPGNVQAASVKVYLDTRRVRGWNEIDAVELIGRDGSRQWAAGASASSTYAGAR